MCQYNSSGCWQSDLWRLHVIAVILVLDKLRKNKYLFGVCKSHNGTISYLTDSAHWVMGKGSFCVVLLAHFLCFYKTKNY